MYVYIYIYVCMYVCMYVYIYIHIAAYRCLLASNRAICVTKTDSKSK